MANRAIFHLLKEGSNIDMAVDGSLSAKEYEFTPSAGQNLEVLEFRMFVDSAGIDPGGFITDTALTNGLKIEIIEDSAVKLDLLGGNPIKQYCQFCRLGEVTEIFTAADDLWRVVVKFPKDFVITPKQTFRVTVQDDFSAAVLIEAGLIGNLIDRKQE